MSALRFPSGCGPLTCTRPKQGFATGYTTAWQKPGTDFQSAARTAHKTGSRHFRQLRLFRLRSAIYFAAAQKTEKRQNSVMTFMSANRGSTTLSPSPASGTARRGVRYVAGFVADPSGAQYNMDTLSAERRQRRNRITAQRRLLFFPSGLHRLPGRHDTAPRTGTSCACESSQVRSGSGITTVRPVASPYNCKISVGIQDTLRLQDYRLIYQKN